MHSKDNAVSTLNGLYIKMQSANPICILFRLVEKYQVIYDNM